MEFTHFDKEGKAIMVDVSEKAKTVRVAVAKGRITMTAECFAKIRAGSVAKGDVLGTARIAGIMGAKKTPELIPLCHNILLSKAAIDFELAQGDCSVEVTCTTKTVGTTGVEMEALSGVSAALLTIYDMCKAVDKKMIISDIRLCHKSGGKSGEFVNG